MSVGSVTSVRVISEFGCYHSEWVLFVLNLPIITKEKGDKYVGNLGINGHQQ